VSTDFAIHVREDRAVRRMEAKKGFFIAARARHGEDCAACDF